VGFIFGIYFLGLISSYLSATNVKKLLLERESKVVKNMKLHLILCWKLTTFELSSKEVGSPLLADVKCFIDYDFSVFFCFIAESSAMCDEFRDPIIC
jgi:hypothetical protein